MLKAILSDLHGNLEATNAVLEDMARFPVDQLCLLGDLAGYGPNPGECLDLLERADIAILGNFDVALLHPPEAYPPSVASSLDWSRENCLHDGAVLSTTGRSRREQLESLPTSWEEGEIAFVHGSPRNPLNEYLFPEDIYNVNKMNAIFAQVGRACFVGHTHIPGVFVQEGSTYQYFSVEERNYKYCLDQRKTIINVGSVGQPRDGDPRASYALFDGTEIRFRRVEYDIDTTIQKMYAIPELENFLADRLRDGR